ISPRAVLRWDGVWDLGVPTAIGRFDGRPRVGADVSGTGRELAAVVDFGSRSILAFNPAKGQFEGYGLSCNAHTEAAEPSPRSDRHRTAYRNPKERRPRWAILFASIDSACAKSTTAHPGRRRTSLLPFAATRRTSIALSVAA